MSPLSSDPAKRERQLANLRPNPQNLEPGAGAAGPGNGRALKHGRAPERPHHSPDWSPAVSAAIADLSKRLDRSLFGADGELLPWAEPSVEVLAIAKVGAMRAERIVSAKEAKSRATLVDTKLAAEVGGFYGKALEREELRIIDRLKKDQGVEMTTLADLSRLADDELDDLERLAAKARGEIVPVVVHTPPPAVVDAEVVDPVVLEAPAEDEAADELVEPADAGVARAPDTAPAVDAGPQRTAPVPRVCVGNFVLASTGTHAGETGEGVVNAADLFFKSQGEE